MPRINRNNAVGLVLGHGIPPRAVYSTQAQGVNSNYLDHSTAKRGETHMRKLPFQVRGAVYETAAALALRTGLDERDAEGLLGVMLDYIGGDKVRVHGVLGPAVAEPAAAPAGVSTASGWDTARPIASLGQQHGTVLLAGEKEPRTYGVGYRDAKGTIRLTDDGREAPWATVWWELP